MQQLKNALLIFLGLVLPLYTMDTGGKANSGHELVMRTPQDLDGVDFSGLTKLTLLGSPESPSTKLPDIPEISSLRELIIEHYNLEDYSGILPESLNMLIMNSVATLRVLKMRYCQFFATYLPLEWAGSIDLLHLSHNDFPICSTHIVGNSQAKGVIITHVNFTDTQPFGFSIHDGKDCNSEVYSQDYWRDAEDFFHSNLCYGDYHERHFPQKDSVQEVDLSHNRIRVLALGAFCSLPNLQKVVVAHNCIEEVNCEIWENLKHLKHLDLSGNKLIRIDRLESNSLRELLLADNELAEIDLRGVPNVTLLDVSRNRLTFLDVVEQGDSGVTARLLHLRKLLVRGNPLADGCLNLAEWLDEVEIIR